MNARNDEAPLNWGEMEDDKMVTIYCKECVEFDREHDSDCPLHPDYDPTPWCGWCGAREKHECQCGGFAENH